MGKEQERREGMDRRTFWAMIMAEIHKPRQFFMVKETPLLAAVVTRRM